MSVAKSPPKPTVLTTTTTGHSNPTGKDSQEAGQRTDSKRISTVCRTAPKRAKKGQPQNQDIILTPQLLRFLHMSPDKGQKAIATIMHRQIVTTAACAEKMKSIMYDIFLTTTEDSYISHQLEKGKQRTTSTGQHKHSNGVSPRYAFMTLLIQAAIHTNTVQYQQGLHPICDLQLTQGRMDNHSIYIHNRLIQIIEDYEQSTRSTALAFSYGHDYQHINRTAMEDLKRIRSLPWIIRLDEPG